MLKVLHCSFLGPNRFYMMQRTIVYVLTAEGSMQTFLFFFNFNFFFHLILRERNNTKNSCPSQPKQQQQQQLATALY